MKTKISDFGQIKLDVLGIPIEIPVKVRVQARFIPDFTVDPTKPVKFGSPLNVLQPKITILIGGRAYQVDTKGNFKEVSPEIFNEPTFLDKISEIGILPTLIFGAGAALFTIAAIKGIKK